MKGKRAVRKARRTWSHAYINDETDPARCTCEHDGMPASWHRGDCPVRAEAWAAKP